MNSQAEESDEVESIPTYTEIEKQEYDHKLLPVQETFGDFTNKLLELKPEEYFLTFIDIRCVKDAKEIYSEVLDERSLSQVLHDNDEQLAMESQGRYPELDITKRGASLDGVAIRVWGWEDDKFRYTDLDQEELTYPRQFIRYEGQKDWRRQLDVNFFYERNDGGRFTESVALYGVSSRQEIPHLFSSVWVPDYSETGYEGHGFKRLDEDISAEDAYRFVEIVAKAVGLKS